MRVRAGAPNHFVPARRRAFLQAEIGKMPAPQVSAATFLKKFGAQIERIPTTLLFIL
jgi:hypothetical protein